MAETADASAMDLAPHLRALASSQATEGPRDEIRFKRRIRHRDAMREAWRARELVRTLAERDLRARYKQTLLGFAWAIVTPLLMMLVFSLVFTKFARIDAHGAPYALFAYLGLVPWGFFSAGVSAGGASLVSNLAIVNKIYCPREVFPIAALVVAAVDALISTGVLIVIFAVTGFTPHVQILYTPLFLAVLLVFTLGMALLVSSLLVYLRDLRQALPLLLQLGLFATPVAYGLELVAHTHGARLLYSGLNPIAPVVDGLRRTILSGLQPEWGELGLAALTSAVVLTVGYRVFKRLETGIADIA